MISRFKTIFVHRSMPIILYTLFGLIFAGLIFAKLIFAIDRPISYILRRLIFAIAPYLDIFAGLFFAIFSKIAKIRPAKINFAKINPNRVYA